MFPREVFEKILLQCDGKTLKAAQKVSSDWKEIVEFLAQKHDLWRKCVHQDIPHHELLQYKTKWIAEDTYIDWEQLYENWLNWHEIKQNIQFQIGTTWKINKISCFAVMGEYMAIGQLNGSVKVFNRYGQTIKAYRHLMLSVTSIHFVRALPDLGDHEPPTELLIVYNGKVYIHDFSEFYDPGVFQNCYLFSSYRDFMCGVSQEGHITIAKICNDDNSRKKGYQIVTYARIYSPDTVKSCSLWENICVILVNDKVRVINYKEGSKSSQFMAVELTTLQFSTVENFQMRRDVFIFHDKVIITVTKTMDIMHQQIFELFILNDEEKRNSKKMFIPWKVFNAFISCVYLYGNTLVIGLNSGYVYFYVVNDWKLFDITNYSESIRMSDHSAIIGIDALERFERREFFVATSTSVRKLIGETVNYVMNMLNLK